MSGMSYPPVQYSGDGGQVSGAFRPASQPPELSKASGGACHYLATGGGTHAFRNESGEDASMLILFTPGAPREDYFETLSDAVRREALSDDEVAAEFYLRHDTYWT